jgi:hypothetical protein
VVSQPSHKPKISAGMSSPTERHPPTGRNLNARGNTAHPHRHRFPGPGSMMWQRRITAQSNRNRRRCAAGESPRAFNSGAIAQIVKSNVNLSAPEFRPVRWGHNDERYDFGLPSLVTFPLSRIPLDCEIQERDFGGAKKVTDALVAQSCCVVLQRTDRFFSNARKEL